MTIKIKIWYIILPSVKIYAIKRCSLNIIIIV